MVTFVTILSIFGSLASVVGIFAVYRNDQTDQSVKKLIMAGCAVAMALSAYVVYVPASGFERNVRDKITYYDVETEIDDAYVMVQRGRFRIRDSGPVTVEFPQPFIEPPDVEVINLAGVRGDQVPRDNATRFQVIFSRTSFSGSLRPLGEPWGWIATGIPMERREND